LQYIERIKNESAKQKKEEGMKVGKMRQGQIDKEGLKIIIFRNVT
jgi:hypothetical protein